MDSSGLPDDVVSIHCEYHELCTSELNQCWELLSEHPESMKKILDARIEHGAFPYLREISIDFTDLQHTRVVEIDRKVIENLLRKLSTEYMSIEVLWSAYSDCSAPDAENGKQCIIRKLSSSTAS